MIRAVLYDVGGVLYTARSSGARRLAYARQLHRRLSGLGVRIPDDPETFAEKLEKRDEEYKGWSEAHKLELPSSRVWREFYLADYDVPELTINEHAEALSDDYCGHGRIGHDMRPDLTVTVAHLHEMGFVQGIVSNIISKNFVPQLLKEYGVDRYMSCTVLSSEVGCRKPDARIFLSALERLGIEPAECAYVGDTISRDVIGARNAQLGLVIQIDNPAAYRRDEAFRNLGIEPDYHIQNLSEIPDILNSRILQQSEK